MAEVAATASPLADSFQRCSRSFKQLYLSLFAYGPISLSKFNDEYGRFGVWGSDSGADRTGRGSLDDVLRNDLTTASIIAELLKNLNDDLSICISLVGVSPDPHKPQSHDGQEWLSDEESSISSRSDASDFEAGSRVPSKTQRILHLLAIIVDHIQSLFQVLTLLRRPTISDRYLRSASRKTTTGTESLFYPWDLAHIIEKRQFWIHQQKRDGPTKKSKVEDIQHQTINYLLKRLTIANVRRREQLDFWRACPAHPSVITLPDEQIDLKPITTTLNPIQAQQFLKKASPRSEISELSYNTKPSFSAVAESDLNNSATFSGRPQTEYESSTKGGKYIFRVPPIPKVIDESPTLKCPYCSTTLSSKYMSRRELWKKHVFRDLRPYVCTFEQCNNSEKLYLTRHDWVYHETQMHRRQWICTSCSQQKFSSRSDMKRHLLEKHAGKFPESQIMIMVDICERPIDDDEDDDCPICLATLSLPALRTHLATHLEELALFVLPDNTENQSQYVGSDKVEGDTRQRLLSNASSSEDELPPLDFEESSPGTSHSQDPETFATLLQSTKVLKHKDIEDWFLTSSQTEQRDSAYGRNVQNANINSVDVNENIIADRRLRKEFHPGSNITPLPSLPKDINAIKMHQSEFQVTTSEQFRDRRVFETVWTEPKGAHAGGSWRNNSDFEQGYTSIRRFVIWKNYRGFSLCIPILTYSKQGTARLSFNPAHHAIIFTESKSASRRYSIKNPPSEAIGEPPLRNLPICVETIDNRHQLNLMSRLNYAKIYTVEHNYKVRFIGRIHKESLKEFEAAFKRVQNESNALDDEVDETDEEEENIHPENRRFKY